jgi:hypothetical protein
MEICRMEKKKLLGLNIVSILKNPFIAFLLGFLVSYMVFSQPFLLIGMIVVIGMALYAFRDRLERDNGSSEKVKPPPGYKLVPVAPPQASAPEFQVPSGYVLVPDPQATSFKSKLVPCPECGSLTKHRRICSHYGETVKKASA